MPFSMNCTNKGCGKVQEPYIDKSSDKVFCSLCDKEMSNVTHFAKMQMKSLNQVKEKKTPTFGVKCDKCGQTEQPILLNKEVSCGGCKKPLTKISETFKLMLKDKLKSVNKDV